MIPSFVGATFAVVVALALCGVGGLLVFYAGAEWKERQLAPSPRPRARLQWRWLLGMGIGLEIVMMLIERYS